MSFATLFHIKLGTRRILDRRSALDPLYKTLYPAVTMRVKWHRKTRKITFLGCLSRCIHFFSCACCNSCSYESIIRHPKRDKHTSVLLGVASPEKFSDSIVKSGVEWKGRDLLTELREKQTAYTDWEAEDSWYDKLRELVIKKSSSH